MNWFNLSLVGWIVLIVALVIAALQFDIPRIWIGIGALALFGLAIISAARHSRPRV